MGTYRQKGFTVAEMLIVIIVIAILAAITVMAFNGIQEQARYSIARKDMRNFGETVQIFRVENDRYPIIPSEFSEILKRGGLYESTRTSDKSYAICASPAGFAFVAWNPIITAYKNGDVLYLLSDGGGQTEHILTNSSLSSDPNRVDKICDQVYNTATYEDWTFNVP